MAPCGAPRSLVEATGRSTIDAPSIFPPALRRSVCVGAAWRNAGRVFRGESGGSGVWAGRSAQCACEMSGPGMPSARGLLRLLSGMAERGGEKEAERRCVIRRSRSRLPAASCGPPLPRRPETVRNAADDLTRVIVRVWRRRGAPYTTSPFAEKKAYDPFFASPRQSKYVASRPEEPAKPRTMHVAAFAIVATPADDKMLSPRRKAAVMWTRRMLALLAVLLSSVAVCRAKDAQPFLLAAATRPGPATRPDTRPGGDYSSRAPSVAEWFARAKAELPNIREPSVRWQFLSGLAVLTYELGDAAEALALAREAATGPAISDPLIELAVAHARRNDYRGAIQICGEIRSGLRRGIGYGRLAGGLAMKGDFDSARMLVARVDDDSVRALAADGILAGEVAAGRLALSDVPGRVPDDERRAKLLMLVVRAKPEIAATDEARQAAGRIASPVWRASVYEALADASLRLHRGELVDDCILQAKAAVARMNEPYEQATALFMIARVEGRAGKHEAAKATITLRRPRPASSMGSCGRIRSMSSWPWPWLRQATGSVPWRWLRRRLRTPTWPLKLRGLIEDGQHGLAQRWIRTLATPEQRAMAYLAAAQAVQKAAKGLPPASRPLGPTTSWRSAIPSTAPSRGSHDDSVIDFSPFQPGELIDDR